jgi:glycosyltransferase involved in cell wall biosynthesis
MAMKLSIAMITYNHEKFIAKAIDSILMQKTNFDYEIVIGEDCSTDNTRNILLDYKKRYPDKFKLFLNETNLGMQKNAVQVNKACSGDYIAFLEGDDYWTSPDKLQKQVDFLDNHPDCSECFHDSLIVYEDGSKEPTSYRPSQKEFSTVEDLLLDNFIPTCSVMFRRTQTENFPNWVSNLKMGDWPCHILNAINGKIGYINETMGVYVVHDTGIWSTKNWQAHEPAIIEMFEALAKHLHPKYKRIIDRILRWRCFSLSNQYESIGDLGRAGNYAYKSLAKHLKIICEPIKYGNRVDSISNNTLPNYMISLRTPLLLRNMLRLRAVPFLQSYVPPLYHLLRAVAQRMKVGL